MLRPIAPFVEYALNYDYISEVLCINKDNPEINCKGKCHLIKQIEKQQNDVEYLQISMREYPIGFVKILSLSKENIILFFNKSVHFFYQKSYLFLVELSVFHPPAA